MIAEESKIENTEKPQAPERSWGEAAVDVIGTVAENYAKTGRLLPALVGSIPAMMNSDSFRAQKNKYAYNNFLMEQARKEAQRADELHPLNVEAKRLANANQQAILGVNQIRLDNLYYNEGIQKAKAEVLERFREKPYYNFMNSQEKALFDNSVQVHKLSEFLFFGNEFQNAYNSKDEKQMARLSRMAAKDGLSFTQNEKGEWILAGNNYKVVINDETRGLVGNYLAQNAAKEYVAILETSQKSTYARADRKLHAEYAKQLVNTSNDKSLASNLAIVKKEIGAMPQSWKNTMLLRQIIDDAASSRLTDSEKMQEAQMAIMASPEAISLLEQEGFSYSMPPDALSLKDVMFYDQKTERHLNFNEMQDVLHERDEGRNYLDNLVKTKGQERMALEQEARRKQELHAIRLLNQGQNQRRNQSEETAPTEGAGENNKPVSPENTKVLIDWFGADLKGKSNNVFNNLIKAVNTTREDAIQRGFAYEDKNGTIRISEKFTDDDLKYAMALEKEDFEKFGMGKYAEKGFWHSLAAKAKSEKELKKTPKREAKIKQMDENIQNVSRAAQSSNPLVQLGANDMAGSMMAARALLGIHNKKKKNDATKSKENAEKRLKAAENIKPEKKKK